MPTPEELKAPQIQFAVVNGETEVVKALLESKKIDINMRDNNGRTLAFMAAQYGNVEILKLLAEAKADLTQANYFGCTPFDIAAYLKYENMIKVLLEFKVAPPVSHEQKKPADYKALYDIAELVREYPKRKARAIGAEREAEEKHRLEIESLCDKFETQFRTLLDKYKQWGQAIKQGCDEEKLISKIDGLKSSFFNENYSGDQPPIFFNTIKQNMEQIWFILQLDKNISDKKKIEEYKKLCNNMYVCAPGFYTHVEHALNNLTAKIAIDYWLAELRTTIINQYADRHVGEFKVPDGFSPHIFTAFLIYALNEGWAPLSKITKEIEVFADSKQTHIDKNTTFKLLTKYFDENYTPQTIADCVSANVFLAIRKISEDLNLKEEKGQGISATPEFISEMKKLVNTFNLKAEEISFFDFSDDGRYVQYNSDMFKAIFLKSCRESGAYFPKEFWHEMSLSDAYKFYHCQFQAGWFEKEDKPYNIIVNWKQPVEEIKPSLLLGKFVAQLPLSELPAIKNLRSVLNDGTDLTNLLKLLFYKNVPPVLENFFDAKAGDLPLKLALKNGDSDLINLLLDMKASVKPTPDWNPLFYAIEQGNIDGIRVLLKHNPDLMESTDLFDDYVHTWTCGPIRTAVRYNKPEVVKLLVELKADLSVKPAIPFAALFGNAEMIKVLFECRADINQRTKGETSLPLHYAMFYVYKDHSAAIKMLLACKADSNLQTEERGYSAIHYAVFNQNLRALKVLAENKDVDFNCIDKEGLTAFQRAVIWEEGDFVKELLNLNKVDDINKPDTFGRTVAFFAAQSRKTDIIKMLFDAKADFTQPNYCNCTPLDIASYLNNKEAVETLSELGIKPPAFQENKEEYVRDYVGLYGTKEVVHEYIKKTSTETKEQAEQREKFENQFEALMDKLGQRGLIFKVYALKSTFFTEHNLGSQPAIFFTAIKQYLEDFWFILEKDSSVSDKEKSIAFNQLFGNLNEPSPPSILFMHIEQVVNELKAKIKVDIDYWLAELRTNIVTEFSQRNSSTAECLVHVLERGWAPLSKVTREIVSGRKLTLADEGKLSKHFSESYTPRAIVDCVIINVSSTLSKIRDRLGLKEEKGSGIPASPELVQELSKVARQLKMEESSFIDYSTDRKFLRFNSDMLKASFLKSCKEKSTYLPKFFWREISLLGGYKFCSCRNKMGWFEKEDKPNNLIVNFADPYADIKPYVLLGTLVSQLPVEEFKSIKNFRDYIRNTGDLVNFVSQIPKEKIKLVLDEFFGEEYLDGQMRLALLHGDHDSLKALLKLKPAFDYNSDWSPVNYAIENNNVEGVKILLIHEPQLVNFRGLREDVNNIPLFTAINRNQPELVALLLDAKARIDITDSLGFSPCLFATHLQRIDVIKVLYEKNVNINQVNARGDAPIFWAAGELKNADALTVLLACKADVNLKNKNLRTALHQATYNNKLAAVKKLVEREDLECNAQDQIKNTPAHLAVKYQRVEILRELAKLPNINFNIKDNFNKTPLDEAITNQRWSMAVCMLMAMKPAVIFQLSEQEQGILNKCAEKLTEACIAMINQDSKDASERSNAVNKLINKENLLGVILSNPPKSLFAHPAESKPTELSGSLREIRQQCSEPTPATVQKSVAIKPPSGA